MIHPPKSIDAAALFRKLLEPRPSIEIAFRFSSAPDVQLECRAVNGSVWAEASRTNSSALIVAESVYTTTGERVFARESEVGCLTQAEFNGLLGDTLAALDTVGPSLRRIDVRAWETTMAEGARACPFESETLAMCVDIAIGFSGHAMVPRPDRYWGLPFSQLLDGHWLAFWASRKLHDR